MAIKVVLADAHAALRDRVRAIVERKAKDIQIVGEVSTGMAVLELDRQNPSDVYVIDISMSELDGIEVTERLIKNNPKSRVIILSMYDSPELVEKALSVGALGYIVKRSLAEEIIHAIREVYKGGTYLSARVTGDVVDGFLNRAG